jgi:hypothetical protein
VKGNPKLYSIRALQTETETETYLAKGTPKRKLQGIPHQLTMGHIQYTLRDLLPDSEGWITQADTWENGGEMAGKPWWHTIEGKKGGWWWVEWDMRRREGLLSRRGERDSLCIRRDIFGYLWMIGEDV